MRAYEAENRAFGRPWSHERQANALDLPAARTLVRYLCDEFEVPQVEVYRARANAGRSMYRYPYGSRPGRISLRAGADALVVCHEVAHHVALIWQVQKGHGAAWATIYLRAVYLTACTGEHPNVTEAEEDRLRRAFAEVDLAEMGAER